jgi:hypothetical protein
MYVAENIKKIGIIILARKLYTKRVAATRYDPAVVVSSHAFGA